MKFFVAANRVISKGTTVAYPDQHTEIHDPEATLIVDGTLSLGQSTNDKNDGSAHIYVKNLVVTPRGKLTIENAQVIVTDNINIFGRMDLLKSQAITTHCSIKSSKESHNWAYLRSQLIWAQENKPDSVKSALSHAEERLTHALS